MITSRTITALRSAFEQAVRENSCGGTEGVSISAAVQPRRTATPAEHQLLVLTIAAQDFRVVVLFDFCLDAATQGCMARLFHRNEERILGQTLTDALAEYVNMVCGTANRLISIDTRRTGMSTPFVLEAGCREHLPRIQPEHTLAMEVGIMPGMRYELLLCLYSAANLQVDFDINLRAQEETVGGELELF